jgi:hypothetical protein
MNVDVEIYMSGVIKFFNENEKDLANLVPLDKKDIFFQKIKERAQENADKGEEITITQKQLIDICVEINTKKEVIEIKHLEPRFFKTKFGEINLN